MAAWLTEIYRAGQGALATFGADGVPRTRSAAAEPVTEWIRKALRKARRGQ